MTTPHPDIATIQDAMRNISTISGVPLTPTRLVVTSSHTTRKGEPFVEQSILLDGSPQLIGCALAQCMVDNPRIKPMFVAAAEMVGQTLDRSQKRGRRIDLQVAADFDASYELAIVVDSNARAGMTETNLSAHRLGLTLMYLSQNEPESFEALTETIAVSYALLDVIARENKKTQQSNGGEPS